MAPPNLIANSELYGTVVEGRVLKNFEEARTTGSRISIMVNVNITYPGSLTQSKIHRYLLRTGTETDGVGAASYPAKVPSSYIAKLLVKMDGPGTIVNTPTKNDVTEQALNNPRAVISPEEGAAERAGNPLSDPAKAHAHGMGGTFS